MNSAGTYVVNFKEFAGYRSSSGRALARLTSHRHSLATALKSSEPFLELEESLQDLANMVMSGALRDVMILCMTY